MDNELKMAQLVAERKRINKEISELKRKKQEAAGVKVVRYPTGRMDLKIRGEGEGFPTRFCCIAFSWSAEELVERARLVAQRINEFCEKPIEEIIEMVNE